MLGSGMPTPGVAKVAPTPPDVQGGLPGSDDSHPSLYGQPVGIPRVVPTSAAKKTTQADVTGKDLTCKGTPSESDG